MQFQYINYRNIEGKPMPYRLQYMKLGKWDSLKSEKLPCPMSINGCGKYKVKNYQLTLKGWWEGAQGKAFKFNWLNFVRLNILCDDRLCNFLHCLANSLNEKKNVNTQIGKKKIASKTHTENSKGFRGTVTILWKKGGVETTHLIQIRPHIF